MGWEEDSEGGTKGTAHLSDYPALGQCLEVRLTASSLSLSVGSLPGLWSSSPLCWGRGWDTGRQTNALDSTHEKPELSFVIFHV